VYAARVHETPPILIAEDNDDDFFFFRRAVRMAGIENPLLRFRDGSELVAFVEKNSPTSNRPDDAPLLLFVDLTMPIMNGFEVLEWMKEHAAGHYLPIVLSGSRREEDLKRAYGLGAYEYLVKPISPVLLAAIAARPARAA
jgi:CheY-like chemotaxis protein